METDLTVHHLSLLEKARYYKHFVGSLPFASAASIVFWSLFFNQPRAIKIAMKCAAAHDFFAVQRTGSSCAREA